jgi:PhnB protein
MPVNPIPEGYHFGNTVLNHSRRRRRHRVLQESIWRDRAVSFSRADGKVGHAELQIGNSRIMLADEYPDMGYNGAADARRFADRV